MIRLKRRDKPHAFSIGGIEFVAFAAGQFERDLAEANGKTAARDLLDSAERAQEYGFPAGLLSKLDGETLPAFGVHLYAVELACIVLESWSGLAGEDGGLNPEPTRRAISILFQEIVPSSDDASRGLTFAAAFMAKVQSLSALEVQEGNGFAAGPSASSDPAAKPAAPADK